MSPLDILFERADKAWEAGNLRSAFRLFLLAAKAGDIGCQVNLGTFYSDGIGVRPNRAKALYWYRRAYRRGCAEAAANVANLFRHEGKWDHSFVWLGRAIRLGDVDSHLDIAKIHLKRGEKKQAIRHLKRVVKAKPYAVFEESREEAQRRLRRLERGPQ